MPKQIDYENLRLVDVLNEFERSLFLKLNCLKIARVVKHDPEKNTVDVELVNTATFEDFSEGKITVRRERYPILRSCPILFNASVGDYAIKGAYNIGDNVVMAFMDRSIGEWYISDGEVVDLKSDRAHSMNDAVCLGVVNRENKSLSGVPKNGFTIGNEQAWSFIKVNNGETSLRNAGAMVKCTDDKLTLKSKNADLKNLLKDVMNALNAIGDLAVDAARNPIKPSIEPLINSIGKRIEDLLND